MTRRLALVAIVALAACQDAAPTGPQSGAPLPAASVAASDIIPGQFIVTLRVGQDPAAIARAYSVAPRYVYRHALVGFAGSISDAARAGLLRDARVVRVEQDQVMHTFGVQAPTPSWGLDRVDQRALPLNNSYTYNYSGFGVTAYIIDTGIYVAHTDFGGRASVGYDALGGDGIDCNGHGTHVSGTVGGATYGIAKNVKLVGVRVLNCSGNGTTSGVVAGIDWVTNNHLSPAVANMSLGGGASTTLDNALKNSIAGGVAYAVAAGNGNNVGIAQDACNYSPARVPEAMTIGATDQSDTKASWSNYGSCVDWFAPGVNISSDYLNSTRALSGTSMATPHTTGVAALVLQQYPGLAPKALRDTIFSYLTMGVVRSSSTTNNHLLYSLTTGGSEPPPTTTKPTGLTATASTRGTRKANLAWSGGAASVDIFKNGAPLTTVTNTGAYTDNLGKKATGTFTYKVCNAGSTSACSDTASVKF